jgi:hypothetical protein
VQTIRSIVSLAKGTQPIPREDAAPQVVVEKIVQVVVEPRVVQVLVIPDSAVLEPAPASTRARRITDAYQATDEAPRKVHVIA